MKHMDLNRLMRVLRLLVVAAFVCNILALAAVPFLVESRFIYRNIDDAFFDGVMATFAYDFDDGLAAFFDTPFYQVWQHSYTAVLTVFLWACGICTAVILWQAKRVLDIMLRGTPFVMENARYLKRAALCCFVVSAAALCRTVWGFFYYKSMGPLLTYNFLFCPLFLMAGLLFLVMSALFRQAAELKAENDLTI